MNDFNLGDKVWVKPTNNIVAGKPAYKWAGKEFIIFSMTLTVVNDETFVIYTLKENETGKVYTNFVKENLTTRDPMSLANMYFIPCAKCKELISPDRCVSCIENKHSILYYKAVLHDLGYTFV